MTAPSDAPPGRDRLDRTGTMLAVGAAVALALVPLLLMGPGTDLDAGAVIRAGRSIVADRTYVASRPPGAPVHELGVGLLDAVGGTVAANLGSLLAAAALAALLVVLLRAEGVPRTGLVVAVVVANPWFLLAASSTVDFLWALALVTGAAVLLRRDRPLAAGAVAALAVGARASTVLLVVALVVAEALGERAGRGRAARFGLVAAGGALLLFVPSFRASGDSLAFAQNDVPTSTVLVQVGRFAVKNLYLVGPFAAVVLLVCLPALWRALARFRHDWLVRFAAVGLVLSELAFLRFPWKIGHLLPSLVCLALLLGRALGDRPRLLAALVVAQLAYGVVNVQLVAPDRPNAATTARLTFSPGWGVLVVDTRCRLDDPDAWRTATPADDDAVWTCAKPWS